jgi:hypothetical protein
MRVPNTTGIEAILLPRLCQLLADVSRESGTTGVECAKHLNPAEVANSEASGGEELRSQLQSREVPCSFYVSHSP